jgi:BirA family biotin operon repressor/biotin-[acetyl-CoA-carboxylase] ligase
MNLSWRVERFASLPSTSDVILELIRTGRARAGDVVVADAQTAGRGRQGRAWISEPGGLWLTAALPLAQAPLGQSALVAAVAACEAAREWAPEVGVKWPNDLVARGGKLGGILVERPGERPLVAVGIGVNVVHAPRTDAGLESTALALAAISSRSVTPENLLPSLLDALSFRWRRWLEGDWTVIRDAWRGMDAALGRPVRLEPSGVEGIASGIDDNGALRVRQASGAMLAARVGEVVFL